MTTDLLRTVLIIGITFLFLFVQMRAGQADVKRFMTN